MDEKTFASLVRSLETSASQNPGAYKLRVDEHHGFTNPPGFSFF